MYGASEIQDRTGTKFRHPIRENYLKVFLTDGDIPIDKLRFRTGYPDFLYRQEELDVP